MTVWRAGGQTSGPGYAPLASLPACCDDILMFTNEATLSIMFYKYCNIDYFSLSYFNIQNYFKRAFYQELHHIIFNKFCHQISGW